MEVLDSYEFKFNELVTGVGKIGKIINQIDDKSILHEIELFVRDICKKHNVDLESIKDSHDFDEYYNCIDSQEYNNGKYRTLKYLANKGNNYAMVEYGKILMNKGIEKKNMTVFNKGVDMYVNGNDIENDEFIAEYYNRMGLYKEEEECLIRAADSGQSIPYGYYLEKKGDIKCLEYYNKVQYPRIKYTLLADYEHRQKRYDKCLDLLLKIENPENYHIICNIARLYLHFGKVKDAYTTAFSIYLPENKEIKEYINKITTHPADNIFTVDTKEHGTLMDVILLLGEEYEYYHHYQ